MRLCDFTDKELYEHFKRSKIHVRSLRDPSMIGEIVSMDPSDDYFSVIQWPNGYQSGVYGSECQCEIVE